MQQKIGMNDKFEIGVLAGWIQKIISTKLYLETVALCD